MCWGSWSLCCFFVFSFGLARMVHWEGWGKSCHINSLLVGGPRLLRCLGVLSYQQNAQALPANVLTRYPYATGAAAHVWAACEAATFTSGSEDSKLHLCGSASHSLSPSKTYPSQGLAELDKSCTFTLLIVLFASSLRSMVGWTWLKVVFQKSYQGHHLHHHLYESYGQ